MDTIKRIPLGISGLALALAAFTFPIVITSVAYTHLSHLLLPEIAPLATVLQVLATCVVAFVFVRYMKFILQKPKDT